MNISAIETSRIELKLNCQIFSPLRLPNSISNRQGKSKCSDSTTCDHYASVCVHVRFELFLTHRLWSDSLPIVWFCYCDFKIYTMQWIFIDPIIFFRLNLKEIQSIIKTEWINSVPIIKKQNTLWKNMKKSHWLSVYHWEQWVCYCNVMPNRRFPLKWQQCRFWIDFFYLLTWCHYKFCNFMKINGHFGIRFGCDDYSVRRKNVNI